MSEDRTGSERHLFGNEQERPLLMFYDDDKFTFTEYRREIDAQIRLVVNPAAEQQAEDCECDCESEFMADMPTNESYTISDNIDEKEDDNAEKFLTEMGLLNKIEDAEHFDLNYRSDTSVMGAIDTMSRISSRSDAKESSIDAFKIFSDPFEVEFNPAETLQQQLLKDPIPTIPVEKPIKDHY